MKKFWILMLLFVVTITGCSDSSNTDQTTGDATTPVEAIDFNVVSAVGAPGLAFAQMFSQDDLNTDEANFSLEYKDGSTSLMAAFADEDVAAIVAPINLGAKFYNSDNEFIYASTVTWGNIFLATRTDGEFTMESLRNQTIYTFGEGSVPYIVVEDILSDYGVTFENLGDATSYTSAKLISDEDAIVMIAEPVLSVATASLEAQGITNIKTIDVQAEYSDKNDTLNYPQAGLFIRKDYVDNYADVVEYFLEKVEISADYANSNPTETVEYVKLLTDLYPQSSDALVSAMPRSNILYKTGVESQTGAEILFDIILAGSSAAIIGSVLPDAGFYYG